MNPQSENSVLLGSSGISSFVRTTEVTAAKNVSLRQIITPERFLWKIPHEAAVPKTWGNEFPTSWDVLSLPRPQQSSADQGIWLLTPSPFPGSRIFQVPTIACSSLNEPVFLWQRKGKGPPFLTLSTTGSSGTRRQLECS